MLSFLSLQRVGPEGGGESSERLVQSAAWEWQPQESKDPEAREEQWVTNWTLLLTHSDHPPSHAFNLFSPAEFEVGASPLFKDPLGWMFSRLDANFDLQLDQSEIKNLYLDWNEPCSDAFFKSCGIRADKVLSSAEWYTCFQRYTGTASPYTHANTCT